MNEGYSPPKSDYELKKDLVQAIRDMKEKMKPYEDQYTRKSDILERIEIVENRKSSVLTVLIIMILFRVMLSHESTFLYCSAFSDMPILQNIWITLAIVFGGTLCYWVISKLLIWRKLKIYKYQLEECDAELRNIYNRYGVCPISFKYAMPTVVQQIEDMIVDGRADTVKEAINLVLADEQNTRQG